MSINQIESAKIELEKVLEREIVILRELLLSLNTEEAAIVSGNVDLYDTVFESRIDIIAKFESWASKLIELTYVLAEDTQVTLPEKPHFSHLEAALTLDRLFKLDDTALLTMRSQLITLLEKIYTQNDRISRLVKDPRYSFQFSNSNISPVGLSSSTAPLKKLQVAVIDKKE